MMQAAFSLAALALQPLSQPLSQPQPSSFSRRAILPAIPVGLFAAATQSPQSAFAAATPKELTDYTETEYGVNFKLPEGWAPSTSFINGGQKLVAASDPADTDANVFAAFTPLRGDYTSLGSFGNIDYVANSILPNCAGRSCSIDRDGIQGRMVEQATGPKGSYVYDYVIETANAPQRHLRTLMSVQTEAGTGRALVTLTAQCTEARYEELKPTFKAVLESFKYL